MKASRARVLYEAAKVGRKDMVEYLFQVCEEHNANTADDTGRTLLHYAVQSWCLTRSNQYRELIDFLINVVKMDVNQRDYSGQTCLHVAVVYQNRIGKELLKQLRMMGADGQIRDDNGNTPHDLAICANDDLRIILDPPPAKACFKIEL